jgi:hypothetical protein
MINMLKSTDRLTVTCQKFASTAAAYPYCQLVGGR